jgi:hypothetical protein
VDHLIIPLEGRGRSQMGRRGSNDQHTNCEKKSRVKYIISPMIEDFCMGGMHVNTRNMAQHFKKESY